MKCGLLRKARFGTTSVDFRSKFRASHRSHSKIMSPTHGAARTNNASVQPIIRPILRCLPDRVSGMPIFRERRPLAADSPVARLHENETPGIRDFRRRPMRTPYGMSVSITFFIVYRSSSSESVLAVMSLSILLVLRAPTKAQQIRHDRMGRKRMRPRSRCGLFQKLASTRVWHMAD